MWSVVVLHAVFDGADEFGVFLRVIVAQQEGVDAGVKVGQRVVVLLRKAFNKACCASGLGTAITAS